MEEEWVSEAEYWVRWYSNHPHTQAYIYQVYNGEGNVQGMIGSLLGYMWEHGGPSEGTRKYYSYLQKEYGYVQDGVRNNPSRLVSLGDAESMLVHDDIDSLLPVESPSREPFEGSPWGRLPLLREVYTTKKGTTAVSLADWLDSLPREEQDILLTFAEVGTGETIRLLGVPYKRVRLVVDKVRRAVSRSTAA